MIPAAGGKPPLLDPFSSPDLPDAARRRFLLTAGGAVAYLALRPALALADRVPKTPPGLQPWSLPDVLPANPVDAARALIGAAVLAPSDWNSQPWRFEVEGNSIRIVAETRRALPATDPGRHGLMIGLGAALENMLVAARAWGQRATVAYLPHEGARGVVAEVSWSPGDARRDGALLNAIPERRTNRRNFDERGIFPQNRSVLLAEAMEGLSFHWLDDRDRIENVADFAYEATRSRAANAEQQREQFAWMRFDRDAEIRGDGVPIDALELSGPAHWFAGRYFNPESWFMHFGAEYAGKQARSQVKSSGALLLITSSRRDETQCLLCGQSYERMALRATNLGIAQQILGAPLEAPSARTDLNHAFGAAASQEPLLLVRLGHAKRPAPTPRRAVSLVSTFRNT